MAAKKRSSEVSLETLVTEGGGSSKDLSNVKKKKKPPKPLSQSKFGGMTEEEVCKLLLPDHMKAGLDIIFVSVFSIIAMTDINTLYIYM